MSKYRPHCIIAYPTKDTKEAEYVRLIRGVIPWFYDEEQNDRNKITKSVIDGFLKKNIVISCDNIITVNAYTQRPDKTKNGIFIINN